jgi:ABC-type branched-subunit amino acid transport system ATPase component
VVFGPSELAPGAFAWLAEYQLIAWGPVALLIVFKFPDGIAGAAASLRRGAREPLAGMDASVQNGERVTGGPPDRGGVDGGVALEAQGISVRFGGLVALSDVSMSVRAGTIHALIGPNGSGKTTLVDCLTGFRNPNAGRAFLLGRDVTAQTPDRIARLGVGRTFQNVALFGSMTCLENLAVAQASRNRLDQDRAGELLATAGLEGFEDTPAAALSYGQRKRLELARALALEPQVLVLDEPAAGRNEPEILELGRLLKRLRAAGGPTILVVEHHMNFVLAFAEVVTVLDEGRVIADGPPAAVRANGRVIEAYLGASA